MNSRLLMVIDLDRCWGCRTCEVACKQELGLGAGPRPMKVLDTGVRLIEGVLHRDFIPTLCQHCDQAACLAACPVEAIVREEDGTIQIRKVSCAGCGSCKEACPFGAMETDREGETPVKCTLCRERREGGALPSCAQHCIGRAITLIDENRLEAWRQGRYFWKTGRIAYVSGKWAGLGKTLDSTQRTGEETP
jgi:Fe-S-cluster-containing dehydrogenase component